MAGGMSNRTACSSRPAQAQTGNAMLDKLPCERFGSSSSAKPEIRSSSTRIRLRRPTHSLGRRRRILVDELRISGFAEELLPNRSHGSLSNIALPVWAWAGRLEQAVLFDIPPAMNDRDSYRVAHAA